VANKGVISPLFSEVWQIKELRADFLDVWQAKELGEKGVDRRQLKVERKEAEAPEPEEDNAERQRALRKR
jgi:hypothetical protein